jgi:hypothetical protein
MAVAAESSVNDLLKDDTLANGYVHGPLSEVKMTTLMTSADPYDFHIC